MRTLKPGFVTDTVAENIKTPRLKIGFDWLYSSCIKGRWAKFNGKMHILVKGHGPWHGGVFANRTKGCVVVVFLT